MNFNYTQSVDYTLQHSLTDELISLYGILVKLLLVEKINKDDLVFGDYSHIKTDPTKIFEVYGYPELTETWDNIGMNFNQYGMTNNETINLYFSKATMNTIFSDFGSTGNGFNNILGNLIVMPNNRIMEITDIEYEVPGVSNLFTQNDVKNVYKLICKTYDNKLSNETTTTDIAAPDSVDYTLLDAYFDSLNDNKTSVDTEAEVTLDIQTENPIIDTSEDSVFGNF